MPRRALALLVLLVLAAVTLPSAASAASRAQVVKDCAGDGVLNGTYTIAELRDARQNLPVDVEEYTDCLDVLRRAETALRAAQRTPTATPAPGASVAPAQPGTPAGEPDPADLPVEGDTPTLVAASKAGDQPVTVGDVKLTPAAGVRVDRSDVPSALVVAVLVLVAAAACLVAPAVRRRLRLRRGP